MRFQQVIAVHQGCRLHLASLFTWWQTRKRRVFQKYLQCRTQIADGFNTNCPTVNRLCTDRALSSLTFPKGQDDQKERGLIGLYLLMTRFVWNYLRKCLPEESLSDVRRMSLTADGQGAVFDVPTTLAKDFVAGTWPSPHRLRQAHNVCVHLVLQQPG